jgi:hypothetical protein
MICFRYIIVNTLHKGDNKDDDDDSNSEDVMGIQIYKRSKYRMKTVGLDR